MSTNNLPWFRAYTKMVDDEKLRLLAFEDRWHFIAILCLKGQGVLDANDPLMMRKAAVKMGLDTRTLEEVARRLAEVGLVDKNTLQPLKWEALQQRSDADPTAVERKRRQRERQRSEKEAQSRANAEAESAFSEGNDGVTEGVTPPSRVTGHEVTRTDIDKDIDTKVDKTEVELVPVGGPGVPPVSSAQPTPPSSTAKKAARLSADWVLPKSWGEWALAERTDLVAEDIRREAACFRDHWVSKSGKDATKLDWQATWRNWVRRVSAQRRQGAAGQGNKNQGAMNAILGG